MPNYRQPTPAEIAQYQNVNSWGPSNIPSPGADPYAGTGMGVQTPGFMDILRMLRQQMAIKEQNQMVSALQAAAQPQAIPRPTYDTPSEYYGSFEWAPYQALNAAIKAANSYGR